MSFRPDMAPAGPTTAAAADTASQLAGSLCSFLSTPAVTTGHNTTLLGTPVLSPAAAANPMPASSLLLHALQQGSVPGSANLPQTSPIGQTSPAAAARLATSLSPAAAAGTLLSPASIPLGAPQTLMMPGTYSVPTPSLATLTQAQLLQLQAQAALAQYTAATTTAAPSNSLLAPAPPSGPLPSISATTQTSTTSSAGGKVMRKVLLSYGGVSSTTSAGGWEYVGGETRLLGGLDSTSCSYDELATRVEAEVQLKLGVDVVLRYELPGCPGTLVDVKCDTDVANMWSEWSDFCSLSKQPTFKLHLYVDRPPVISTSANSSRSAGRSSDTPLSGAGEAVGGAEGVPPSSLTTETLPTASTAPSPFAPKDASPLAGSLSGGSQHQAHGSSAEALTTLPAGTVAAPAAPVTPAVTAAPAAAPSFAAPAAPPAAPRLAGERGLLGAAAATAALERLGMLAGPTPNSSATPSLASFDRLVSRVKSTVEMIRPADLRIIRFMGSGGFADCYLAKWLGVEVAVKCLRDMPGAHTSSRAAVKELLREASILSGMRHPNVLCLYAVALPDQLAVDYGLKPPPPSPPAPVPHSPPPAPSSGSGHPLPSSSRGSHPALTTVVESQETDGPAADEEPAGGVSSTAATTSPTGDAPSAQPEWAATPAGLGRLRTPSSEKAGNGLAPAPVVGMPGWPEPPSSGRAAAAPTSASGDEEEAQEARSKTATRAAQQLSPPTSPFAAAATEASPEGAFGSVALLSPPADAAAPTPTSASSMPTTAAPSSSPATTEPQVSPQRSAAFTSTNTTVTANISFGLGSPAPTMSLGTNSVASGPSDIVEPEPTLAPRPDPPLHQGGIPSYLYSTEDDETIRKSVLAAEAAAAASADVESQTAVSEGLITRPALVAEFLSGCSLGSAITRKADFLHSDLVLTKVAMDAARGMEYCHGKKITHWNLKPGNLIVGFSSDKVPLCKVADIGLLRPRQLAELDDAGVARVLPWAAPELVRAPHTATEKVDVYSFGMCMWSMWARKHPYTTVDIAHVFLRTMQGHVVRPPLPGSPDWEAMYPGEAPPPEPAPGWSDLMQRCWAPQPAARPPFSEVAAALISMFNAAKSAKRATRAAAAKARHGDARGAAPAQAAS